MTPERVSEVLNYCRENMCTPDGSRVCFLCDHEPDQGEDAAIGVFIPDAAHQKRVGAPPNKTRMMIYLLCGDCYERPDRNERVEDKIFATVVVQ